MATWAVIENEKKILLIRRSTRTSRPGQWCFPGGGIKEHESPESACVREAKEETGLDIGICNLITNVNNSHFYRCNLLSENQKICLKLNECDEFSWVSPSKLLDVGIIMDLKTIFNVLSAMDYSVDLNDEAMKIIS